MVARYNEGVRQRAHVQLPSEYWDWTEDQQKDWAANVATQLQQKLLRDPLPEDGSDPENVPD